MQARAYEARSFITHSLACHNKSVSTFDYETSQLASRAKACQTKAAGLVKDNQQGRSVNYLLQNMKALGIITDDDLPSLDKGFLIDNRAFARVDGLFFVNGFQTDAHLRLVRFVDGQPLEFRIQTLEAVADALDGLAAPIATASCSRWVPCELPCGDYDKVLAVNDEKVTLEISGKIVQLQGGIWHELRFIERVDREAREENLRNEYEAIA